MSYDMNNEDYKEHIEMLCLANLPIEFYGKYIRHLTVKEIMLLGNDYNRIITPFTFSKEMFNGYEGAFYTLEALICFSEYLDNAIILLKKLFNTENIQVFGEEIVIDNELFIDKFKFEELTNIILKMFTTGKYKDNSEDRKNNRILSLEEIDKIKDNREKSYQKRKYEVYMKQQKEKYKFMGLSNVYNTVVHSSDGKIDYNNVLEFNIYQLYNTFNILHKKDDRNYTMSIATSGYCSDVKKLDLRPLSQRILTS